VTIFVRQGCVIHLDFVSSRITQNVRNLKKCHFLDISPDYKQQFRTLAYTCLYSTVPMLTIFLEKVKNAVSKIILLFNAELLQHTHNHVRMSRTTEPIYCFFTAFVCRLYFEQNSVKITLATLKAMPRLTMATENAGPDIDGPQIDNTRKF